MNGKNLILQIGGTAVAASKSCRVRSSIDLMEIAAITDGEWKNHITKRKSWEVSCDYLYSSRRPSALLAIGQTVTLSFVPVFDVDVHFDGEYAGSYESEAYPTRAPEAIYYAPTSKKFVALVEGHYYLNWTNKPALLANPQPEINYINDDTSATMEWLEGTGLVNRLKLTGTAICTDVEVTANIGQLAAGSYTFKGTGALSVVQLS